MIVVRGNRESPRNKAMYRVGVAEQKLSGNSVIQPSVPMDTAKGYGFRFGPYGVNWAGAGDTMHPTQSSTARDRDASSRGSGTYQYLSPTMRGRLSRMEPK